MTTKSLNLTNSKSPQRFCGIDFFRGIAILGVIILHVDNPQSAAPELWLIVRQMSKFAVPFFLLTSFFLAINRILPEIRFALNQVLKERFESIPTVGLLSISLLIFSFSWLISATLSKIKIYRIVALGLF
jgi:peptidoglycan/LPS O-acetylase OafA/YrhL